MPIIPYEIRRDICKLWRGKRFWRTVKKYIDVEVSEEVAAFLKESDKYDKRYNDKIRKQIKAANIVKVFSLNEYEEDIFDDTAVCELGEITEDTVHPENRNPLAILLENEELAELDHEYLGTMTKKQYEVFQLYEQGYNNTEVAKMLKLDESSVRERLHSAFRAAVMAYLTRSNWGLFFAQHNEFKSYPENAKLPKHKFNEYLGVLFINRLSFFRHDQIEYINFVLETDYEAAMKKYFLDFITETPENGT